MKASLSAGLFLILTIASAPVGAETGVTSNEIVIGSCAALSGKDGFVGQQTILGAKAYLNGINAQGGVHGRKIKLLSYDHEYVPDKAIACFNQLIQEGVFASAFGTGTPTLAKMAPMAQANKVPLIGLYSGAEFLSNPVQRYVINVKPSYQDEVIDAVEHLWNDRGVRKIAVIYQADALGSAILDGVKKGLTKFDSRPVAQSSFDRNNLNADEQISSVKGAEPEVVFIGSAYSPAATIIKRARENSWEPLFVGFSGIGAEGLIKEAGSAADGVVVTEAMPPVTRTSLPAVARYVRALKRYFPKEQPNLISLEGYVDAAVLVEGLKRAGNDLTREGFIDAIESINDWNVGLGANNKISYSSTDHKGLKKTIFNVVRNGNLSLFNDWKTLK